ncbi:hypothetical protein OG453_02615 [Streptomyces sp. NBC_01381]|uniref:hypothetical protein n=1 Tax=Streptomyces sp. NBC_01381 TaxID=2903845 RepID=UPI00224D0E9C|nr:hypothetical protein [Streptomyces sp. NBC_01381]MCX4665576.1 hypothetical protein [Streptomyces sp. NBC_01381]
MSSRTRSRTRTAKAPAGATTVRIPRQRSSQPFIVVVPDRPSLSREALGFLGRLLWKNRRSLAPLALAVLALPGTAVLHALAWWSGLLLAPLAAGPLAWLLITQRRRPAADRGVLGWRIGLTLLATTATAWVALAAAFGPLAGPLELLWLLTLLAAQTAWLIVRRTH